MAPGTGSLIFLLRNPSVKLGREALPGEIPDSAHFHLFCPLSGPRPRLPSLPRSLFFEIYSLYLLLLFILTIFTGPRREGRRRYGSTSAIRPRGGLPVGQDALHVGRVARHGVGPRFGHARNKLILHV